MNALESMTLTAMAKFNDAKEQIAKLTSNCQRIVINSNESLETAKNLAKTAKKVETLIEDKRKEITAPILAEKKKIDDFAKSITNDLNKAMNGLRSQILSYEKKLQEEREAEARRIEEERKRIEEELKAKALEGKIDESDTAQVLVELKEQEHQAQISTKSSSIRLTWTYDVIDESVIPREYLTIDERKIKDAITAGKREITGLKIYQKESLVLK
ncbi:MAG: hypothetical protein KF896_15765 [Ignavibacteriae bacterium]|nr:hypothetical protein [Ignavibacteriota bacterium]